MFLFDADFLRVLVNKIYLMCKISSATHLLTLDIPKVFEKLQNVGPFYKLKSLTKKQTKI